MKAISYLAGKLKGIDHGTDDKPKSGRFQSMITLREPQALVKPVGVFVSSVKMADRTYAISRTGSWHRMYLVEGENRTERRKLDYKYRKLEVKQLKANYA